MKQNTAKQNTAKQNTAKQAWNKFRVLFVTQFATHLEYRAESVIWMLSSTISLTMMLVWMAQAAATKTGTISGYNGTDFATYFLGTWFISQLIVVWVVWELDIEIRQGTLSPKLLRPLDPMWIHYVAHVSERLIRVVPMIGILAVFVWLSGASFTHDWRAYVAALSLAFLGFSARFLWEYIIGLMAFWLDSSTSFQQVVWLSYAALGGMFAPLSFYPQWVQDIAVWTPFPYMLGLPAQLLAGKASLAGAEHGALILSGWVILLWFVRLATWKAGLKKYGAVGA